MAPESLDEFRRRYRESIAEFHNRAGAARWALPIDALAESLYQSCLSAKAESVEAHLRGLNAEDLALAAACRVGIASAWDHFVEHFRPILYSAARAIAADESRARELADSLYAELYGIGGRGESHRPLISYFHGRSSLATWLRAVLAQRHVDAIRAGSRLQPLDEVEHAGRAPVEPTDPPDPDRAGYLESFHRAFTAALGALEARDRMRLSLYYLEDLTLKQVGAAMNEYESTVSRRLDRSRKRIRQAVEKMLRRDSAMTEEQIRLCYDYAIEQWECDLRSTLQRTGKSR